MKRNEKNTQKANELVMLIGLGVSPVLEGITRKEFYDALERHGFIMYKGKRRIALKYYSYYFKGRFMYVYVHKPDNS